MAAFPPRRGPALVSVPVWLAILSDQLPVIGLVGRYPTNKLIGRKPIPERRQYPATFLTGPSPGERMRDYPPFWGGYPALGSRLLTCYSTVCRFAGAGAPASPDLHVLGTPPAFPLSQDQARSCL